MDVGWWKLGSGNGSGREIKKWMVVMRARGNKRWTELVPEGDLFCCTIDGW